VREVVIVLTDLYLPGVAPDPAADRTLPGGSPTSGLEEIARFAHRSVLAHGWRPWLARWLGLGSLADAAPGAVAAMAIPEPVLSERTRGAVAWMATPVHLTAGLTSLHLDWRGLLRLSPDELRALASDFERLFAGSGFSLTPLASGDFLLFAPEALRAEAMEPARLIDDSVANALPAGGGAAPLRKLGAEIEMWLHDHPVNIARTNRGERAVSTLWLWGHGPAQSAASARASATAAPVKPDESVIAFGTDAYVAGLCTRMGAKVLPLPAQLGDVFGYSESSDSESLGPGPRAVLMIEISQVLSTNPQWGLVDGLGQIDRAFIAPAIQGLRQAQFELLHLLANDRHWSLRARDRYKLWRRPRVSLESLW